MKGWMRSCRLRVAALLRRRQLNQDLEDELGYHMEMLRASGSSRPPFGNAMLIRETTRDLWSFRRLEDIGRDIRHAFRILSRTPIQTSVIILLLAVGIGANTIVFSLINPLFVRDLGVERQDELFLISVTPDAAAGPAFAGGPMSWSTPQFQDFRGQFESADLAATGRATAPSTEIASLGGSLDDLNVTMVSGNYFRVLGVAAETGRVIAEDDDRSDAPNLVFVLSHHAWQRHLAGDPDAVGRRYDLFGRLFTLIGVTPSDFAGLGGDFWVPLAAQPFIEAQNRLIDRNHLWLDFIGRPNSEFSVEQVEAEARVLYEQLQSENLAVGGSLTLAPLERGFAELREQYGQPLEILMAAVGLLLLIACANVGSLLLARSVSRRGEIAIRQALGCGKYRLVRQFLVESFVLAGIGGLAGLLLSAIGTRAVVLAAAPAGFRALSLNADWNVLLFTLVASAVSAMMFGVWPAWRASRFAIESNLKSDARSTTASRSTGVWNRAAVIIQTALSVILVAGAVLFGQSLYQLYTVDPGFDWRPLITASVDARAMGYGGNDSDEYARLAERLVERISTVPGVISASVTGTGFLTGSERMGVYLVEGREPETDLVRVNQASRNFLGTTGIPVVAGRGFTIDDRAGAPRAAIVNEALARTYFPGESAIGKRLWPAVPASAGGGAPVFPVRFEVDRETPIEIVGIASDSKYNDFREEAVPLAYFPIDQDPRNFNHVQIRVEGDPGTLIPAVRAAILDVDSRLNPERIEPLRQSLDRIIAQDILLARLNGVLGVLGLALASFGVYGLVSYVVVSRTEEIGIRLALGARPAALRNRVIGDALKMIVPGLVLGTIGAFVAKRYVESILYGVSGEQLLTYLAVAASLVFASAVAAYFPARRASRIDPARVLGG